VRGRQFVYNRYDKFAGLEAEARESLKGVADGTPIGEVDDRRNGLRKALKIVRATVKTSERMENMANSVADQTSQIMEDFREEEEEKKKPLKPTNPPKARMKYLLIPKPHFSNLRTFPSPRGALFAVKAPRSFTP
jgi:hypothetical protein